jgi:hypothetical protein
MKIRHSRRRRSGTVMVLAAIMMIALFAFLAFAVDLGYIQCTSTQLQRSADAAAIASAWELIGNNDLNGGDPSIAVCNVSTAARKYVALNTVGGGTPTLAASDVTSGYLQNPSDQTQRICTTASPAIFNTVEIRVRKAADTGGEVPLFFARLMGIDSVSRQAAATAAFINNFSGFDVTSSGGTINILPFALDKGTWDDLICRHIGTDNWKWDDCHHIVVPSNGCQGDGILEVNLYPQGTGSPGNRGTVDIGSDNNSTADISRQIRYGISAADMAAFGRPLRLDANRQLFLNGDTGISAGVKDDLASIVGQKRIIPIFTTVTGNGNNATYTIVGFGGVRIMDVCLTGSKSNKRLIVQPAKVIVKGGHPGDDTQTSHYMYSPVWLVR